MPINWTKIYKKYKGLWVALADDEITVLGSGKSIQAAVDNAEKKGHRNPILTRVPEKQLTYIGAYEV